MTVEWSFFNIVLICEVLCLYSSCALTHTGPPWDLELITESLRVIACHTLLLAANVMTILRDLL